jgi:hypothetical protein
MHRSAETSDGAAQIRSYRSNALRAEDDHREHQNHDKKL